MGSLRNRQLALAAAACVCGGLLNFTGLFNDAKSLLSDGLNRVSWNHTAPLTSLWELVGAENVTVEPEPTPDDRSCFERGFCGVDELGFGQLAKTLEPTLLQRAKLCGALFVTGTLAIIASMSFLPLILAAPRRFVVLFTAGQVLIILSSVALAGPLTQLQTIFHEDRVWAALAYVGTLMFAMYSAFYGGKARYILVLTALALQTSAMAWYLLSYIPYGRFVAVQLISAIRSASD